MLVWSLFAGLTVISQFGAIVAGAPVALVVLLLYTQPIWTVIMSRLFFKIAITKLDLFALIMVILGVTLLVNHWNIHNLAANYLVITKKQTATGQLASIAE